jgi:hypothetical protein
MSEDPSPLGFQIPPNPFSEDNEGAIVTTPGGTIGIDFDRAELLVPGEDNEGNNTPTTPMTQPVTPKDDSPGSRKRRSGTRKRSSKNVKKSKKTRSKSRTSKRKLRKVRKRSKSRKSRKH